MTFNFETILQVCLQITKNIALCVAYIVHVEQFVGSRHVGASDGMGSQRSVDDHGRERRLRQVLAKQHEQCENVSGTQRRHSRFKVGLFCAESAY